MRNVALIFLALLMLVLSTACLEACALAQSFGMHHLKLDQLNIRIDTAR